MKDLANSAVIGACLLVGLIGGAFVLRSAPLPAPGPTPAPVVPMQTLRTLVDAKSAAELAAFYRDFARAVTAGGCSSVGVFREAHQSAMNTLQDALPAEGWAAINAPIDQRLQAAVGLADVTLEPAKRAALAGALTGIAQEFGG